MKLIDAQNVFYTINGNIILNDLTFSINLGDYLAIIGPNGAGKTSLLRILLGLIKPTDGKILYEGKPLKEYNKRYHFGYVPQRISSTYTKFPATVYEIIESGLTAKKGLFRSIDHDDREQIQHVIQLTRIENIQNTPISQLSGGQLQRVFIARSLVGKPKLLLLDEPTVGIDLKSQEEFYQFLQELNHTFHLTILIVTHEVDVAIHRAKQVMCLNQTMVCNVKSDALLSGSYLEKLYGKHTHIVAHTHYEGNE